MPASFQRNDGGVMTVKCAAYFGIAGFRELAAELNGNCPSVRYAGFPTSADQLGARDAKNFTSGSLYIGNRGGRHAWRVSPASAAGVRG